MPQGSKENVLSVLLKSLGQVGLAYPDVKREQEEQQRQSQIDAFNRWLQEQTLGLRRQETEANISNMQADNERMESQKRTDLLMKLLGGFRAEGSTPEQNFSYKYGGKDITQIPDVDLGMFMPSALQYKYPKMGTVRQGGGSGGGQGQTQAPPQPQRTAFTPEKRAELIMNAMKIPIGVDSSYNDIFRSLDQAAAYVDSLQNVAFPQPTQPLPQAPEHYYRGTQSISMDAPVRRGAATAQPQGITPTRRSDMPADWPGTEQEWQDYKRLKGL